MFKLQVIVGNRAGDLATATADIGGDWRAAAFAAAIRVAQPEWKVTYVAGTPANAGECKVSIPGNYGAPIAAQALAVLDTARLEYRDRAGLGALIDALAALAMRSF